MKRTLTQFSADPSIIVTKPDKGKGIVIMNRADYVQKMGTILADVTKFVKNHADIFTATIQLEDKVNRFISTLRKNNIISDDTSKLLRATGSKPGIMYGAPKVHKKNIPLRPVLSTIGTPNYKLSKYLVNLLTPFTGNSYTIKDSFTFASEINKFPNKNYTTASFDIKSLFTNIPVSETMDIIINQIFVNDSTIYEGFDRKHFRRLLEICMRDNLFLFDDQLYTQKDSAPMGGCAPPTIADLFLSFHESRWLNECPRQFKPVLYRRYVDDTFLVF